MHRSALYYPYIDITDAAWLRSALLFWDTVQTIVPDSLETPYQTPDSSTCFKEGVLVPLRCGDYTEVIDDLSKRTLEILQAPSPIAFDPRVAVADPNLLDILRAIRTGTRVSMHPDKLGNHLHPEKVSEELRTLFERAKDRAGIDWMVVNKPFSDIYMATLAMLIARKAQSAPVTNGAANHGSALLAMLSDSPDVTSAERGTLVTLTMENLTIDPATRVDKIIDFKRARGAQLAEFHSKLDQLESEVADAEDSREIQVKAEAVYKKYIRKGLDDLAASLRDASIQSAWEGIHRAIFFAVPAQSTLAAVSNQLPYSHAIQLGVGAFVTLTDITIKTFFARRKIKNSSPFTYVMDATRKFGMPTTGETLSVIQEYQQGTQQ
jgi:hypothetical protein